jgi:hypothetical protein
MKPTAPKPLAATLTWEKNGSGRDSDKRDGGRKTLDEAQYHVSKARAALSKVVGEAIVANRHLNDAEGQARTNAYRNEGLESLTWLEKWVIEQEALGEALNNKGLHRTTDKTKAERILYLFNLLNSPAIIQAVLKELNQQQQQQQRIVEEGD